MRQRRTATSIASAACVLVLAACSSNDAAPQATGTSSRTGTTGSSGVGGSSAPTTERKDIDVVGDGATEHEVDLYLPQDRGNGPFPLVIWVHGGGWKGGDKADVVRTDEVQMIQTTEAMRKAGYAVAAPNYRLLPNTTFPQPMQDVAASVRYLRNHASELGVDPHRFALMGDSAGAHLAAMVAMTPQDTTLQGTLGEQGDSSVRAFVGYYGIYDLRDRTEDQQNVCGQARPGAESSHGRLIGADPDSPQGEPIAAKASPITYVTKDSPPALLISGREDCTAPYPQAEDFSAALKGAGVDTAVTLIDKAHGDGQFFTDPAIQQQVVGFLDKHVKG